MKKRIENYLPRAIEIIEEVKISNSNGIVNSKFNGYFSAFGASIIQSGMKPALAFYSNTKTVGERAKILSAVFALVTEMNNAEDVKPNDLLPYYIDNETNTKLKHDILDAAVALKLAVRTYELKNL